MASFNSIKLFGCSVRSFSCSLGWNHEISQMNIQLVQDTANGDLYTDPQPGILNELVFYGFRFEGILQRVVRRESKDGLPLYEANVVDPRELLSGVQVIIGAYNGNTRSIPNLVNAYGYYENLYGFGASQVNDGGMPWNLIKLAILDIVNGTDNAFGGPIKFSGRAYKLDFSNLPVAPDDYRIGGVNVSLLDAISQLCQEAGHDFFVELVNGKIKIRTISRLNQPPLGTISTLVNSYKGVSNVSNQNGLELRNEITSAFIVGGEKQNLHTTGNIYSFWGYDVTGFPVVGFDEFNRALNQNVETFYLNASPVADILGSTIYKSNVIEMRCALFNFETWAMYMEKNNKPIAQALNLTGTIKNMIDKAGNALAVDKINDDKEHVKKMAEVLSDMQVNHTRFYEFVKSYAQNYYGKKYLCTIPFLLSKAESASFRIQYSQEPTEAGYPDEGSNPLNLSALNQDVFTLPDGRIIGFSKYSELSNVDYSNINPADTVFENNSLFTKIQIDPQIVLSPYPAVIVTLPSPVFTKADTIVGDINLVKDALGLNEADFKKIIGKHTAAGYLGVKIHPSAKQPSSFAIPLRSNIDTYGPWYAAGAHGKVSFQYDASLVPWGYAGYTGMNLAGNARVATSITNMQLSETGYLELTGTPTVSLGDILEAGGPNVTNITVNFGSSVTTTYRFETYTQRWGSFAKTSQERLRKLTHNIMELRKNVRQVIRAQLAKQAIMDKATRTFLANAPKHIKKQSPHQALLGIVTKDGNNSRVETTSATYEEAFTSCNPQDNDYLRVAIMSWSGLIRPFSTDTPSGVFPGYIGPSGGFENIVNRTTYNPFASGNDIEVLSYGNEYEGLRASQRNADTKIARPFSLRGPMVVTGWGYDLAGNPTPGSNGSFTTGYLKKFDQWNTGPVDHLWDSFRGVWTSHDILIGKTKNTIAASGTGRITVWNGSSGTGQEIPLYNWFNASVGSGASIMAGYSMHANKWYIIAADC